MTTVAVNSGKRARPPVFPQRNEMAWRTRGGCRGHDPEGWFPIYEGWPTSALTAQHEWAVAICRTCPVLEQCRTWALQHRERHGIWGGLWAHERRLILAHRDRSGA
jgi:WhiB family redox-sensing transcriptional regulator